jgi:hypothetical protein
MRHPRLPALAALALLAAPLLGCLPETTVGVSQSPQLIGEGRRALFVGNSYLYFADIPGIVQALADSAGGDKIAVETVAGPDVALIDHWNDGTATREIRRGGWEWVILQQGPSSVDVNRDTLRLAAQLFAGEIAQVSATPALFSAWPSESRREDFARAIESYTLAAADVSGILLPVASGWLAEWDLEPTATLYSDGLHPSGAGAYLSALVVYAKLLGKTPRGLPPNLRLRSGAIVVIDPALATQLQEAAAQVTGF